MKHRIPLPPSLAQIRNYVAGEFVTAARQFPNISPINGAPLADVHEADAALVDRAVQAARAALNGPWGKMAPAERAAVLHKVADGIERRFEEFVAAEVADTGRPVVQARSLDVYRGMANFRTFADLVKLAGGETYEMRTADGQDIMNYTVRKPHGVVGIISPWNLPLLLLTWKVAPALACGNTVVVKPSEE
ncbi:MAG: aldehyde dehydrogenase family protein, partial [Burkholderiales bacterium]